MRKRLYNVLSLVVNMMIVFFICDAVYYNFRTDITRDNAWFGFTGFKSLRFFTNLSNIFAGIIGAILVIYAIINCKRQISFPKLANNIKICCNGFCWCNIFHRCVFLSACSCRRWKRLF